MLTLTAISPLLFSLASAAVISQPQQLLVSETTNLTNVLNVKKFAIDDMSDAKFRLHHVAAKALLGENSYIALREAEIDQRQQDIWQFLWNSELRCPEWGMDTEDRPALELRPKLWFSDNRVFDVDPAHVPQEVITALEELSEKEWKNRQEMRRQRQCNLTETVDKDSMALSPNTTGESEYDWHIVIPEEYLQYLIPESAIEEEDRLWDKMWQEEQDLHREMILAVHEERTEGQKIFHRFVVSFEVNRWSLPMAASHGDLAMERKRGESIVCFALKIQSADEGVIRISWVRRWCCCVHSNEHPNDGLLPIDLTGSTSLSRIPFRQIANHNLQKLRRSSRTLAHHLRRLDSMAASSDIVATCSSTALLTVIAPDGRVITLPPEIVDMILEHLRKSKGTLSLIMCTSNGMFDHTFKLFWESATLSMLNKLATTPEPRRQRYADVIREIKFTIGPNQILPPLHGIMFSQLKRLAIIHDSMQPVYKPVRPPGCHVNLAHFMVSTLTEVRLTQAANALGDCSMANFTAGNFLPHMARNCPHLETLVIDAKVYAATPSDLINVLRSCKKLENLGLGASNGGLGLYRNTFAQVIAHPRLRALHQWFGPGLNKIKDALQQASKPALANLTDLDMMIDASAVTWLLPHLSQLKRLRLELDYGGVSVFPYLSCMTTLVHLDIRYVDGFILTGADLEELFPLKKLEVFLYFGHEQDNPPAHTNIAGPIRPSTKPCELHELRVFSIGMDDCWHVRQQLLTIAQSARMLKYLHVDGTFDFRLMESSEYTLYPELQVLVAPIVYEPETTETTTSERAGFLASLLSKHAPKLEGLYFTSSGLGQDIKRAWEVSHENRQPDIESFAVYPQVPLGPKVLE
ncbi:uncharacterized protein M437DRAFT_69823 [Aureobasidium melanogenum CBS 110374]|uniref:F-box domain-containing protein n=1 Tax=Aureobasidium melanogenum (strain CBS 110374) TaxID=1043003 RepID=A0A074VLY8_AURM1|nr:uncharacterized protein M437DRAFT_69823 [Aureobasidium melanogenum CBS 110374]KEQ58677.1 hypothetical protein M437DRAFT_69823 [Aureobasidium melanogenum CBS 110374]